MLKSPIKEVATWTKQELYDGILADSKTPERLVVEGATVVCTQMYEPESQSKMKKRAGSIGVGLQGSYELTHKDIEFEPKFEKCRYCDSACEPEIEGEQWEDYDEGNQVNGEYGILEEKSFMVCMKGYGVLYISDDGQRPNDMKRLLATLALKHGDRAFLGRMMCAAFGGDPVNMATGNFIFARTDLEIGGRMPVKFQRFYNTIDDYVGPLGKGWYHPYDIKLTETIEGITIRFEDGHDEVYKVGKPPKVAPPKTEATQTKGYRLSALGKTLDDLDNPAYETTDGNDSQLMRMKKGHRLVKPDGTTLYFDQAGNLTQINDQDQVETLLTYEDNQLTQVVTLGVGLRFTYQGDQLVKITDHTGRVVTYTYEGNLLTSATDPLGNVRTYAYDEKGRFQNEINPEGNLTVENEYDEKDRTIKQKYADGSEMGYAYDDREPKNVLDTFATTFTAQNGAKTLYYRDIYYRTTDIEYPDFGEIQTEYNWKEQKISETDKIGPRTYYDYDHNGNLSKITNPLQEVTELTYDENNQLTSISVGGVTKLQNEYDREKNLILAEDALKRQVRFTYDKATKGLPTHIVQPDGSVIKVKYDRRRNGATRFSISA